MPVASAAPSMPMAGKGPMPKISTGSRMMLATQPISMQTIEVTIRPIAWVIFSKTMASPMGTLNNSTMLAYRSPMSKMAAESVKAARKAGMASRQTAVSTAPCRALSRMPSAAARPAVRCWPAPRKKAMTALTPMAKPMVTALTRFCTGYTSESAVMASSLIWATK